ncbi:MAG: conserved oligomeric Golgi complex subunit 6, partial [Candidatus Margulisbacteria bacterium]|nr:conserved oligomeric Golgi complex subunit 6 [Candidatus Margulisiibacteriota bacterium]
QEIEKKILQDAGAEANKIKQESEQMIRKLNQSQEQKMTELRAAGERETALRVEEAKRAILVPARLNTRKALLEEKQKILGSIYNEIQKEKKLSPAEIARIREETEVEAAQVLFGK